MFPVLGQLIGLFVQALLPAINALAPLVRDVFGVLMPLIKPVIDQIVGVLNIVVGLLTGNWTQAWNGVKQTIQGVVNFVLGVPQAIYNAIMAGINWIRNAGGDIINGLINGLSNAAGALWNWLTGLLNRFWNNVKSFFGFGSPSKLMQQAGEWVGQGLVNGLTAQTGAVLKAADDMTNAANVKPTIDTSGLTVPNGLGLTIPVQTQGAPGTGVVQGDLLPGQRPGQTTEDFIDQLAKAIGRAIDGSSLNFDAYGNATLVNTTLTQNAVGR